MNEKTLMKKFLTPISLILITSLILGVFLQIILPAGDFWKGTFAGSSLFFLVTTLLYAVWKGSGRGKKLAWMMVLAFAFRLILGIFLTWGLPRFGYDVEPQQAGFVFQDAYQRERSAWELAQSGDPLIQAFSDEYETDQYGGLLAMNAFVYRYISPDAFRPVLITILTSAAFALSLPFLTGTIGRLFGERAALWGGWIFGLYPEGILLGASQMREPFLILFFSLLTWSTIKFLDRKCLKLSIGLFIGSAIFLNLFSIRVGIPILGIIFALVWVMESARIKKSWLKAIIWLALLGVILGFGLLYRDWLREIVEWDARLTLIASGRIQYELESLPSWLHLPFIVFYGIFQPVLPAAVAAPAPFIWRGLAIFRALGWYAIMPLLAYALVRIIGLSSSRKKRLLTVLIIFAWAWILIASARAGGDQWDNPRYRTIFLPWMAVIAGWVIDFVKEQEDHWLTRILIIEGIFLAFFTEWYISRYYPVIPRLDFWVMILLILVLSMGVIILGWLQDKRRAQAVLTEDEDSL